MSKVKDYVRTLHMFYWYFQFEKTLLAGNSGPLPKSVCSLLQKHSFLLRLSRTKNAYVIFKSSDLIWKLIVNDIPNRILEWWSFACDQHVQTREYEISTCFKHCGVSSTPLISARGDIECSPEAQRCSSFWVFYDCRRSHQMTAAMALTSHPWCSRTGLCCGTSARVR